MRILHLRNSDLFGSPERLIIGQVKHLPDIDFICASYTRTGNKNDFLDQCAADGIAVETIHERFTGDFRPVGRIKALLQDRGIDVLVTHDYKSNLFGHLAARGTSVRHLAHFHGVTSEDFKVKLYNVIDRFVLRRIPRVIAVSHQTARRLVAMGVAGDRINVIPNAVPTAILHERSERSEGGPVKIVAAGRLSHEKGFDLLLKAIARLDASVPDFHVSIYGKGPELERLQALTRELKLADRVSWEGFVSDILPVFDAMDFLVLSSRSEGMPVIILEAWARQLGVMATKVGGVPELIEDGKTGLLIEPENVADLTDKLQYGLLHRELMQTFGKAGYQKVRENYTFERQATTLEQLYREVTIAGDADPGQHQNHGT